MKPGADMDPNNATSLLEDVTDKCFRYGDMLAMVRINAGYNVDNVPREVAINVKIDYSKTI